MRIDLVWLKFLLKYVKLVEYNVNCERTFGGQGISLTLRIIVVLLVLVPKGCSYQIVLSKEVQWFWFENLLKNIEIETTSYYVS